MYKKKLVAFLTALEIENIPELLNQGPEAFEALGLLMKIRFMNNLSPNKPFKSDAQSRCTCDFIKSQRIAVGCCPVHKYNRTA